jgi:FADH2-dependent halogenase
MKGQMRTPVAIVGGGPGGSACAIHLARLGVSSVIIERDSFPRFHIGESLTEQSGSCLRELGFDEKMLCQEFPVKYGVSIYGPAGRKPFWVPVMRRHPDGSLQSAFTWQVRRSKFDKLLLDHAQRVGARLIRGRAVEPLRSPNGSIRGVSIDAESNRFDLECEILVDASGQSTFLANARMTGPKLRGNYDRQIAIYSHFTGALRDLGDKLGNTLIYFQKKHHWAWFIPLDQEVTSIGFVVPSEYFRSRQETTQQFLLRELREFNRALAARVEKAQLAEEVRVASNYSYEVKNFVGDGWLCIGDAHRFIDPLFSFGVSIALSEAGYASRAIYCFLKGDCTSTQQPLNDFEKLSLQAVGACQTVIDGFWENTLAFGMLITRHRDDIVDLLGGHVWDGRPNKALDALNQMLASQDQLRRF